MTAGHGCRRFTRMGDRSRVLSEIFNDFTDVVDSNHLRAEFRRAWQGMAVPSQMFAHADKALLTPVGFKVFAVFQHDSKALP